MNEADKIILEFQKATGYIKDEIFEQILIQYQPLISLILSKYKSHLFYEDLQQELYVILFTCSQRFDKNRGYKFLTYFMRIASTNVSRKWSEMSNAKRPWRSKKDLPTLIYLDNEDTKLELSSEQKDITQTLYCEQLIEKLPAEQRNVIELYFYQGKTLKTIGEELGVSYSTVNNLINKALISIKKKYPED